MNYERIEDGESRDVRYRRVELATTASWIVNWLLLFVKAYVFWYSWSKAVVAALVDSAGC